MGQDYYNSMYGILYQRHFYWGPGVANDGYHTVCSRIYALSFWPRFIDDLCISMTFHVFYYLYLFQHSPPIYSFKFPVSIFILIIQHLANGVPHLQNTAPFSHCISRIGAQIHQEPLILCRVSHYQRIALDVLFDLNGGGQRSPQRLTTPASTSPRSINLKNAGKSGASTKMLLILKHLNIFCSAIVCIPSLIIAIFLPSRSRMELISTP